MLEQKKFFTRNGEYTNWEKIQALKESCLQEIINKISEFTILEDSSSNRRYIYRLCEDSKYENIKDKVLKLVNTYFYREANIEKTDFNGLLFKMDFSYFDIENSYRVLQRLNECKDEYELNNPQFHVFLRKEQGCIDIRLSTTKLNEYKDNSNEQMINTELRLYFKLGLILMTDYSEYTHSKTIKMQLIDNIQKLLTNTHIKIEPYKLSDMTLRVLLKKSKRYSSKFKFSIDDFMDVDFIVSESINEDPLKYDGLKEFYDKHQISAIKISMSANEDKYISIYGEKGKIISRSKSMEVRDIDEFIELLSYVIKYDYLNSNYKKRVKDIAKRKLIGPTATKMSKVDSLYLEVENSIKKYLGKDQDLDNITIIKNAFFYCLTKGIYKATNKNIRFYVNEDIIPILMKVLEIDKNIINKLFDSLISLLVDADNDDILESIDKFINSVGELNVNEI